VSDHGRAHATLSPSSAERWLVCPASLRMIASLDRVDDGGSEYAAEGTRAHDLAEIEAAYVFDLTSKPQYRAFKAAWLKRAEEHGDDVEEMERHVQTYVYMLQDVAADLAEDGHVSVRLEERVQTGVPGCWGTADAVLLTPRRLHTVDFKYGRGVRVEAEGNPQLRLYAVGALELLDLLGTVEEVGMSICQPRTGGMSHDRMSAVDLYRWRDEVVMPAARATQHPDALFGPSEEACRWCPAAGVCGPRKAHIVDREFGNPNLLAEEDLAGAVLMLSEIRDWCNAVEAEALKQAYSEGKTLPGLKVVLSGGKRSIPDQEKAIETLVGAGYDRSQVARESVQTLSALERLVGKRNLPELLGPLLVKSDGKPALVPVDDPRQEVTKLAEAQDEFGTDVQD